MGNSTRWRALMRYLADNYDCTKDEIITRIDEIKKGDKDYGKR